MPDEQKPKPMFAAIPLQAIGDHRLRASHYRTLAAIAWHDRFRANGQGCWTSIKTLADETGLDITTVSDCTSDLQKWGYLTKSRHPFDRRRTVYSVIYQGTPQLVSVHGKFPKSGNNEAEIVSPPKTQVTDPVDRSGSEYISRSENNKRESSTAAKTESPCRARLRLEGARTADDDDDDTSSGIEEKKLHEAPASKRPKSSAQPDWNVWAAWLQSTYAHECENAWLLLLEWSDLAEPNHVSNLLNEAARADVTDIKAFMADRLRDASDGREW